MTKPDLLPCPSCHGEGYTVEVRPVCCGALAEYGDCHGGCAVPEQYQEQCGDCCGTGEISEESTPNKTAEVDPISAAQPTNDTSVVLDALNRLATQSTPYGNFDI